jgi:hypothetical protein
MYGKHLNPQVNQHLFNVECENLLDVRGLSCENLLDVVEAYSTRYAGFFCCRLRQPVLYRLETSANARKPARHTLKTYRLDEYNSGSESCLS